MVDDNPSVKIGQDSAAILVNREEKIAFRGEVKAGDIRAMGEWEGV